MAVRIKESATATLIRRLGDNSGRILAPLRRWRPIVAVGPFGLVPRADDVREVLGDHEHFTVSHYAPKMAEITGPFILGLDDTPLYRREDAALRAAFRRNDLAGLADATLAAGRDRMAAADGRIDVVSELADPVIDSVIASYLGTPGPDTET